MRTSISVTAAQELAQHLQGVKLIATDGGSVNIEGGLGRLMVSIRNGELFLRVVLPDGTPLPLRSIFQERPNLEVCSQGHATNLVPIEAEAWAWRAPDPYVQVQLLAGR